MPEIDTDVFQLLRRFRHDLLNDLQILGGHLQMNKGKDVLTNDIQAMTRRIQQLSRLFGCGDEQLAVTLWALQESAVDQEVGLDIDVAQMSADVPQEWLHRVLMVGAQLISHLAALPEPVRLLRLHVSPLLKVVFELPPDLELPGELAADRTLQVQQTISGLQITVRAEAGEE